MKCEIERMVFAFLNNCASHSRYFQPANKKSILKLKKIKKLYRLKIRH